MKHFNSICPGKIAFELNDSCVRLPIILYAARTSIVFVVQITQFSDFSIEFFWKNSHQFEYCNFTVLMQLLLCFFSAFNDIY